MTETIDKVITQFETKGAAEANAALKQHESGLEGVSVKSQQTERSTVSLENKFKALERQLGTTAGQQQKFEQAQSTLNRAVAQNPELAARSAEAVEALKAKYLGAGSAAGDAAKSTQLAGYQMLNFTRQLQDVGVSLIGGQSPFMVVAQQLPQITDISKQSGVSITNMFKQAAAGAASFVTPMNVAIASVVALGAATVATALQFDKLQTSSQRAITGAGARTGTNTTDINNFVTQNSGSFSAPGLTEKEARSLAEAFTSTGEIVISRLHGMGEAVVGFANQTGSSFADAKKVFVGFADDPKKSIAELTKAHGALDEATRRSAEALLQAGDKTGALQVVIDSLSEKSKAAAENMGYLEKKAQGVVNVLGREFVKPSGLENQIEATKAKLNAAIEGSVGGGPNALAAENIKQLTDQLIVLQNAAEKVNLQKVAAEMNQLSTESENYTKAIFPQIDAIQQLDAAIRKLEEAKAAGVAGPNADAAIAVYKYQADLQQESLTKTVLQVQATQNLQKAWGGVSVETAKQLEALKDQETLLKAQQNGTEKSATAAMAYKNAILDGKSPAEATAIAMQTSATYTAQAEASAGKWRQELVGVSDQLVTIDGGLTYVLGKFQSMISWQQGQSMAQQENAQFGSKGSSFGQGPFAPKTMPSGDLSFASNPAFPVSYKNGGSGAKFDFGYTVQALQQFFDTQNSPGNVLGAAYASGGADAAINALAQGQVTGDFNTISGNLDALMTLKNAGTSDKTSQASNLQREIDILMSKFPTASLERDQKITDLRQAIEQLTKSTDDLNSTNSELLSPYYTQDPRKSKIGFRSQGMASGGYVDVPGAPSANDNMIATIPVAGGERIYVDPMPSRRGMSGAASNTFNITIPVTIAGNASKDEVGRTFYQVGQTMAKQIAQASR